MLIDIGAVLEEAEALKVAVPNMTVTGSLSIGACARQFQLS